MGPVVRLRLEHGYGRELPPGHRAMLQGDGEKPDWAREYGSGNSGEEGGWMPVGWRERVRLAAARAEEEERQARRDLDEEAREERVAREAAADLLGGGELAIDGRTGSAEGDAICVWEGEESGAEHGADGGEVIEVRAYEEGGEAPGDEARPEPRLLPRRREGKGVFVSRKNRMRREHSDATEGSAAGGEGAPPGVNRRYQAADERSADRRRERIERKNAKRAERVGAAAARRGAED